MSGAGVAFPVRFFSVHFRCDALLCTSSPKHYLTLLLQGVALPFFSFPMRCFAILLFPGASRSVSSALLCISSPAWGCAFLLPGVAQRFFSKALLCISNPTRCGCKHCRSYAAYCISFALLYLAVPIRGISLLCTAPLCPCQAKQCQCLVLLFYSAAVPGYAVQFHACASRRLSARTIACTVQSLVKNCPTQPSALRGRPFAQGAGWLIMVRMRWRSASGFSVPCSTTTSS